MSYRANRRYASAWQAGVRDFRAHEGRSLPGEHCCVHWQLPRTSLRVCRARWYYPPRGACAAAVRNLSCRRRAVKLHSTIGVSVICNEATI